MSEFKIEKNVPFPEEARGRKQKYPFGQMEVGDSFYSEAKDRNTITSPASYYAIRHKGFKFSVRREGEGFRVWRVACDKAANEQEQTKYQPTAG